MIRFNIITNSSNGGKNYENIIRNFMSDKNEEYNIYLSWNDIIDNSDGKKIYLFDIGIDGIEWGMKIRKSGDYCSQIIILLDCDVGEEINLIEMRKLFLLDIIRKNSNYFKSLNVYLNIDYNILNDKKGLCFKYNNELFNILYDDIYYIEKNLYNNDSTIFTYDSIYVINLSINKLMEYFGKDYRFFKCHRSCIVNINNIISYDISNNVVKFKNREINLVSRNNKKKLMDRLYNKYQKILK